MMIKFGNAYFGLAREAVRWVVDLTRYKTVRFIGYGNGRLFIGLICASKDGGGVWAIRPRTQIDAWEVRDRLEKTHAKN